MEQERIYLVIQDYYTDVAKSQISVVSAHRNEQRAHDEAERCNNSKLPLRTPNAAVHYFVYPVALQD